MYKIRHTWLPSIVLLVALTGCASSARVSEMVAYAPTPAAIPDEFRLRESMALAAVLGGESTNPLWTSEVGNREFQEALRQSLIAHNLLSGAGKTARYALNAHLIKMKQPFFGFSFTVTSEVKYTIYEKNTNYILFDDIITASHTASIGDAFLGTERLRLANEGSIKENISVFINRILHIQ